MRLRPSAAVLAATALTVAVATAPAVAAGRAATTLTIQTEQDGFSGFVKSKKRGCHSGRTVTLYRKVSGPDKRAGSDVAQPNQDGSQWKVSVSRDGTYYAVVKATSKCAAKTSATRTITLDDGEGAAAAGDDLAPSRLRINRGRPRGVAGGILNSADHPECVDERRILVYRAILDSDRNIIRNDRIGFVITEPKAPGISTYAKFSFKVSRSGYVKFKTLATDECGEAESRYQHISAPER